MPESVAERPVQVGPVVDGVHLVDADAVEGGCVGLDGVEQGDRFTVRQRHDQVGSPDRCGRARRRVRTPPSPPVSASSGRAWAALRIGAARCAPVTSGG